MRRGLGWTPPTPERPGRVKYAARAELDPLADVVAADSSESMALLPVLPYDQGGYNACVAPSTAQAIIAAHARAGLPPIAPSLMAIWQRALSYAGDWGKNTGTQICTALDLCAEMGTPLDADWPYDEQHRLAHPGPTVDVHSYAWRDHVGYHALSDGGDALIDQLERACTAGFVVPFGVAVTEAFCNSRPSGTVHAPGLLDAIAGNHAMVVVGHDRPAERFLVRNSWGPDAGDPSLPPGYLWLGYDYLRTAHDACLVVANGGAA
jgi:hypothetical protein